jgi:hypothetical protein
MKKLAYVFDLLSIIVFVAIGRHAHSHGLTWRGMVSTAWPFIAGLIAGWVAIASRRLLVSAPRSGLFVVLFTVVVGMTFRVLAGQGIAFTFILVALTFISIFLVGWRAVFSLFQKLFSEKNSS